MQKMFFFLSGRNYGYIIHVQINEVLKYNKIIWNTMLNDKVQALSDWLMLVDINIF